MGVECKTKIFTEVNHSTNIPSKSPGIVFHWGTSGLQFMLRDLNLDSLGMCLSHVIQDL